MLKGIGASPGIVLGKALVIEDTELVIERKVQNYKVSPKSLNETYGELIDENDKKL